MVSVEISDDTLIPSQRATAFNGLSARSVLKARNALMLPTLALSATKLTADICNHSTNTILYDTINDLI